MMIHLTDLILMQYTFRRRKDVLSNDTNNYHSKKQFTIYVKRGENMISEVQI